MVFNSLAFLLFLPTVVALYYVLPHRFRWMLLLLASYFFYGFWKVEYLALILASTVVDFTAARNIAASQHAPTRRIWLLTSLVVNLGMLFVFKYTGWFLHDVAEPLGMISADTTSWFDAEWSLLLPVGISFYTFQTISYTIDVYYDRVRPTSNLFHFALFVSFFPQLVAGPIERFSRLHHQLLDRHHWQYANLQHGGRLILYGLFIKMCVADNIAPVVNQIFGHHSDASGIQLVWGAILFGIQIFSDFHGYSLIAIGSARLLGIHLIDNFRSPYESTSIREFWQRWHISLSTWFRDYVYKPMGGSRTSNGRLMLNILVVFAVSGLWHGANWTFVIWGLIHGTVYLLERFSLQKAGTPSILKWLTTMFIVFVAWIFFRASDVDHAIEYIGRMLTWSNGSLAVEWDPILVSFIGLFLLSDRIFEAGNFHEWVDQKASWTRWITYAFMLYAIMAHSGSINHPFIYFQF